MVKHGFLIDNGEIFDTKIQTYAVKKEIDGENIIYSVVPCGYKRLYLFEALLTVFSVEYVFRVLNYNKHLKKDRENEPKVFKEYYMANAAVVYNYPPTYLNKRKFQLYKLCQKIKEKLD